MMTRLRQLLMVATAAALAGCASLPAPRAGDEGPVSLPERARGADSARGSTGGRFDPFYGMAEVSRGERATTGGTPPQTAVDARRIEARALLARLRSHTGLGRLEQARIDHVSSLIDAGRIDEAMTIGSMIESEFETIYKPHRTTTGETLWSIAAREDVYANAELWPLIWHANLDRVPEPSALSTGTILRIRSHPTVGEVVQALDEARGSGSELRIGPIRRTD